MPAHFGAWVFDPDAQATYEGRTFLQLEMTEPKPVEKQQVKTLSTDVNSLGWRYVPKVRPSGGRIESAYTLFE
jgi:hypothetical protein